MSDRSLTSGVQAAIDAAVVRPAILLFLDLPGGAVYSWTGTGNIDYDGNTYLGVGDHLGFSEIPETADSSSQGIEITLSGIDSTILPDVIGSAYQGADCRVDLALFDAAGAIIADPITLFRGLLDRGRVRDDGENATIVLSVESRLLDLLRPRQWRYTDADQQLLYPGAGDLGLEFVPRIQNLHIEWGS